MPFYIDLTKISLKKFKKKLKEEKLLPSQQILKENIDQRFETIMGQNLKTMADLQKVLKNKKDVSNFSSATGLPEDFLTVLRREVNSYHPQPRKIKDFPKISEKSKKKLEAMGIKSTMELYDLILTEEKREKLRKDLGCSKEEALLLAKLSDLTRIRYVNQTFATLLTNSDFDTAEKVSKADYRKIHTHLLEVNEGDRFFKGKIPLDDMRLFVKDAGDIPMEIEY